METTITYRPLEEWSPDELITLEDQLWGGWIVAEIDFDGMRRGVEGGDEDGFGAAPDYGDWLEHHLTALDRILTEAGYPKIPAKSRVYPAVPTRGWTRSVNRLEVPEGGSST